MRLRSNPNTKSIYHNMRRTRRTLRPWCIYIQTPNAGVGAIIICYWRQGASHRNFGFWIFDFRL